MALSAPLLCILSFRPGHVLLYALPEMCLDLGGSPKFIQKCKFMNKLHELLSSGQLTETALNEGGGVLLDLEGQQILSMNEVGMKIVHLLRDEPLTQADLAQWIAQAYGIDEETAARDVGLFIQRLSKFLKVGYHEVSSSA